MSPRVLFVDDDPILLLAYRRAFRGRFEVQTAQSGFEALDLIRRHEGIGRQPARLCIRWQVGEPLVACGQQTPEFLARHSCERLSPADHDAPHLLEALVLAPARGLR